jgi:MFS family permease
LEPSANGAKSRSPAGSYRHRRSFWAVAFAFFTVMAFSTVPSPLYGLYRSRDHFSTFMITVIFAVYAVGVIAALLLAGHLSDIYGRRRLMLPALGIAIASAVVFLASKSLGGLLVARLLNGIAIGVVASAATAYLAELHAIGRPDANPGQATLVASVVNVGGLGVGALVAGVLAQWVAHPLSVVYFVFLGALLVATIGIVLAPETREAAKPAPPYRPQRLSIPREARSRYIAAALSTFVAFAAIGLLVGLAGLFLRVTLHHPSVALAGGVVCVMFGAGVVAQVLTRTWPVKREFAAGMVALILGLGLAVLGVWLHPASLGLFIAGGALIGVGSGAIFRGAVGTVMSISPPEHAAESLTGVFLASYLGISVPVIGAGITLARHVTPKVTLLSFAIGVTVGIAGAAFTLFARPAAPASLQRNGN